MQTEQRFLVLSGGGGGGVGGGGSIECWQSAVHGPRDRTFIALCPEPPFLTFDSCPEPSFLTLVCPKPSTVVLNHDGVKHQLTYLS